MSAAGRLGSGFFIPLGRLAAGPLSRNRLVITYRLSGRQAKEITARGQALWIAIPEPPDLPPGADLLAFARAALPDPGGEIVSAEQMELSVEPPCGPGLAGVLGAIQSRPSGLSWLVAAIVVQIRPARVQGEITKIQWPVSAHLGDLRWPRRADDADV